MGGTDSGQEGSFVWNGATAWTYQNWAPRQPDNHLGAEDCVHMRKVAKDGKWNDRHCRELNPYVCQFTCK